MILGLINSIFKPASRPKDSISGFFKNASKKEKEKIMLKVARKANADQRALIEKHDKMFPKTT